MLVTEPFREAHKAQLTQPAPDERSRPVPAFAELIARKRGEAGDVSSIPSRILAVDPGDTTGWALFVDATLKECGHVGGNFATLEKLIHAARPDVLVIEEYRIYGWRAKQHSWSDVPTLRLIGGMQMLAQQMGLPVVMQTAQQAKGFSRDEKLRSWNFYQVGKKHANDAIRHACYYVLFGTKPQPTA